MNPFLAFATAAFMALAARAADAVAPVAQDGSYCEPVDLLVKGATGSSIILTWIAQFGSSDWFEDHHPVDSYELRYSQDMNSPFEEMTPVTEGVPAPAEEGTPQEATIVDLPQNSTFYFVMRSRYETALSDSREIKADTTADRVTPDAITDLSAALHGMDGVRLAWTAPGDDGPVGRVAGYELRYSKKGPIITDEEFSAATASAFRGPPQPAGSSEAATLSSLEGGVVYHFAVRAVDDAGNSGKLSSASPGVEIPVFLPDDGGGGSACGGVAPGRPSSWIGSVGLAILLGATSFPPSAKRRPRTGRFRRLQPPAASPAS